MKFHTMRYALLVMMLTLFLSDTTVFSADDLLGKLMYKVLTVEERMDNLKTQFQSSFDGLNARLDKLTDILSTKSLSMDIEVSDMEEAITTAVAKIVQSQYTVLMNFIKEEKKVLSETKHQLQANVTSLNTVIEQEFENQENLCSRNVNEMKSGFDELLKQSALQTGSELKKQDRIIQELSKNAGNVDSQIKSQGHQLSEHSSQINTTQRNLRVYQSSCSSVSDRVDALKNTTDDVESQVTSQGHQLSEHSDQLSTTQRNLRVYQSSCSSVSGRVDILENKAESFVSFSTRLSNEMRGTPIGTIIKFDDMFNNYGSHYNYRTGKFTAPVRGIYVFIFFIASMKLGTYKRANCGLYVDGYIKSTAISDSTDDEHNETGGNSVIVELVKGQEVYIKTNTWPDKHDIFSYRRTTFSGALLYAA